MWTSQSGTGKQTALAVVCAVVGLALAIGFRDFHGSGGNALAGFLLGVLLLVIAVAGLLVTGKQTVVVDPAMRRITVEDVNLLGAKERSIPFGDVVGVGVGFLGKRSNYVTWYYLALRLRDGKEYALFSPGRFFKGASDRSTVESWKQRLERYLAQ